MILFHPRARTILRFADGEASPAEQERVNAHITRCTTCRAAVVFQRGLKDSVRMVRARADVADRGRKDGGTATPLILHGAAERPRPNRNPWQVIGWGVCAATALALAAVVWKYGLVNSFLPAALEPKSPW